MIRTLRRVWNRLLGSLSGRRRESDLAEELDSHIRLLAEEEHPPRSPAGRSAIAAPDSSSAASSQPRKATAISAVCRSSMPSCQDLRYAFRGIRKNPGFAAVAILSLAIGIGANTAIFSLVNAVLLQPLAYKDPHRVFAVREISPQLARSGPVARQPGACSRMGQAVPIARAGGFDARRPLPKSPAEGNRRRFPALDVPHNLFALFGVEPILGRTFLPEEEQEGNDRVVILSESLWRSRFNADPSLVGKSILIDGQNHQVVGIVPASFRLPYSRPRTCGSRSFVLSYSARRSCRG